MEAMIDGNPVFGITTHVRQNSNPSAAMIMAYFGIDGIQWMSGGSRGRTFFVDGMFVGQLPSDCVALEVALESIDDGNPHQLIDTTGSVWDNVVYRSEYQRTTPFFLIPQNPYTAPLGGWAFRFSCLLHGLA